MNKTSKKLILNQLEDNDLYKLSVDVAKNTHNLAIEILDEQRETGLKVNAEFAVTDLTVGVAEAMAAIYPQHYEAGLARARKGVFGVKNIYKLAKEFGYINPDPDLMVKINNLQKEIEENILKVRKQILEQEASSESKS